MIWSLYLIFITSHKIKHTLNCYYCWERTFLRPKSHYNHTTSHYQCSSLPPHSALHWGFQSDDWFRIVYNSSLTSCLNASNVVRRATCLGFLVPTPRCSVFLGVSWRFRGIFLNVSLEPSESGIWWGPYPSCPQPCTFYLSICTRTFPSSQATQNLTSNQSHSLTF